MSVSTAPCLNKGDIILWHTGIRQQPVTGVITSIGTQTATIKVRDLSGQIQYHDVPYGKIEVRS